MDAVGRATSLTGAERVRVLTSPELVGAFGRVLPSVAPDSLWVEPTPKGTGPALAWAAWRLLAEDPGAVMVSLHADHVIRPQQAFRAVVSDAISLARHRQLLVTVGVRPDRAEPGFGYLQPGARIETDGGTPARQVVAFHEKPDPAMAERYLADGFLWNTGIFVWEARTFLEEVRTQAPEIGKLLPLLENDRVEEFFRRVPTVAVDVAVLERSARVGVMEADFEWDDVGSWESLARTQATDSRGNVVSGKGYLIESSRNVVFSDGAPVVLFGVDDLVVVRTERATLITRRARSVDLKELLDQLPETLRRLDNGDRE